MRPIIIVRSINRLVVVYLCLTANLFLVLFQPVVNITAVNIYFIDIKSTIFIFVCIPTIIRPDYLKSIIILLFDLSTLILILLIPLYPTHAIHIILQDVALSLLLLLEIIQQDIQKHVV